MRANAEYVLQRTRKQVVELLKRDRTGWDTLPGR